jgi:hypothetical protein
MKRSEWPVIASLLLLAAVTFSIGITWGLPSRQADGFLFGERQPWTGAEIMALAPQRIDPNRGADVDANPVRDRTNPVWLNETNTQRAEIVRRYRLFTYQPDEMITMMSLSGMSPGKADFDPRLYQYGGLWVYPVGALLKLGGILGLLDVRADRAFYLDNPAEFAKFYIVARAYSAAWGVAGVAVVYWLMRRIAPASGVLGPAAAGICFALMPAVINAAHEAKPHLAGAVLTFLAIGLASKYVETGQRKWWIAAGATCGAALGMVISGLLSFIILPAMVLLRRMDWPERVRICVLSAACGLAVYAVTNPYVPINALFHRNRLSSNLGNSTAMYRVGQSSSGIVNAAKLVGEGASPVIAIGGTIVIIWCLARGKAEGDRVSPVGWLLVASGGVVLLQFVLLAAGKPGEYGRFALVPPVPLALGMVGVLTRSGWGVGPIMRGVLLIALTAGVIPFGVSYEYAFIRDTMDVTTRLRAARDLSRLPGNIGVFDEPAPYGLPPVNLFERNIVLMPLGRDLTPEEGHVDLTVRPVDDPTRVPPDAKLIPGMRRYVPYTRISWAAKRFEVVSLPGARASVE